jgi:HK97 family phage prohead protease
MNVEHISVPLQLKSLESGQFEGYGSTFGNIDLGGDVVMRGAFKESLQQWKSDGELPQMFWGHKPDQVPGKWLDMSEDSKGLKVKGELLPTSLGKDLKILMDAKAIRAMSIGFSLDSPDDYEFRDGVRLLHRINLWEVSPVSMPMNPKAKINAVKALLHKNGKGLTEFKRQLEQWFREQGLSKSQSIALASKALAEDDVIDFGATPRSEKGEESSEKLEESRRDAGEANEVKRAAKALAEKFLAVSNIT